MNKYSRAVYDALRSHVTGQFGLYTQFIPDRAFHVVLLPDTSVDCQVIEYDIDHDYLEYKPTYIVFKVGDAFFKLNGYSDSYGGVEWDDYVTEVSRNEKTVYLYE